MSARARWQASRLREKYARVFKVSLEEVEIESEGYADRFFVFAPKHPDLPKWDTGVLP